MEIAIFDPKSGASGDMIISSLIDAGADKDKIKTNMKKVTRNIGKIKINITKTQKTSISALKTDIDPGDINTNFQEMKEAIKNSEITEQEKNLSIKILKKLKKAEDSVHGENTDFHEIGRIDALADIVGSVTGYIDLKMNEKEVLSTYIHVGGGHAETSHGLLPVPTPATLEILNKEKIPWCGGPTQKELLTPTGAAILSVIVDQYIEEIPSITTKRIGIGAGQKKLDHPNILRLIIASKENKLIKDKVSTLETNIDDISGEEIGYIIPKLMEEGALDASIAPCIMKKGRMGNILKVITKREDIDNISETIIKETGTLGIRINTEQHRMIAKRETKKTEVFNEEIEVKIGKLKDGTIIDISAEYDDCVDLSRKTGIPLRKIKSKAEKKAREMFN